jgi:hypothetical protein
MPFPAGPRLPRANSQDAPVIDGLRLNPQRRAALALALLRREFGTVASESKSRLTAQIDVAGVEWASRHPALRTPLPRIETPAVLYALYDVAPPAVDDRPATLRVIGNLRDSRIPDLRRPKREAAARAVPARLLPFGPGHFPCVCMPHSAEPASEADAQDLPVASESQREEMRQVQAGDFGEWKLLTAFFLKLVHGHLGLMPSPQPGANSAVCVPVMAMLGKIVYRHPAQHADTLALSAAAIALRLETLSPFCSAAGLPRELNFEVLPQCFNPFLLEPEAQATAQARKWLVGGEVGEAACLAREVASLLTDPMAAPLLEIGRSESAKLKYRYGNTSWHPAMQRQPALASHVRDVLKPRATELKQYFSWMEDSGLASVERARTDHPSEHAHA